MRLEGDPSEPVLPRLRGNGFWWGTPEASSAVGSGRGAVDHVLSPAPERADVLGDHDRGRGRDRADHRERDAVLSQILASIVGHEAGEYPSHLLFPPSVAPTLRGRCRSSEKRHHRARLSCRCSLAARYAALLAIGTEFGISCQPSSRRSLVCPLRRRPKRSKRTASSVGNSPCVLVRRRNSSLMRSSAFVVRSAFHCDAGKRRKVKSSSPASSKLATTGAQRRRHFFVKATRAFSTASRVSP